MLKGTSYIMLCEFFYPLYLHHENIKHVKGRQSEISQKTQLFSTFFWFLQLMNFLFISWQGGALSSLKTEWTL